jgi:glyoxylase-like metal-dependent hydrolase (beta-lactamase superfamily II)
MRAQCACRLPNRRIDNLSAADPIYRTNARLTMRRLILLFALFALSLTPANGSEKITPHCTVVSGPINGVLIERDGAGLAVYGWADDVAKPIEQVLLPHGRRDLVWKTRPLAEAGVRVIAPQRELYFLEKPREFWDTFSRTRYHDYGQQTTKVPARPFKIARWVKEGDEIDWRGITFRVLETPGFTRGSISYVARLDGKNVAFTGDLIFGDGKIIDLYSFQDAIPAAKIRGYHGYGARLAGLVSSLQKIAGEKPDVIVPARGPVIRDPQAAIGRLKERVQSLYRNYLSTNALHWYFKEDRMRVCGERVLGAGADIQLMPYSQHEATPDWIFENSTSRLLVSDSGHGFLLDCGYQRVIDTVQDLISKDIIKQVDGIFVTHYHDDHTNMVQAAAERFRCPVYATKPYADVLEHPEAYHLPAMTENAVKNVTVVDDGYRMKWQEFDLTFHFFPGQTWYHGALLVKKKGERPVFFIGDSFAPSGIDDYCVLNRNLVHEDSGYLRCLKQLRAFERDYWLINEHIPFVFTFNDQELDYLETRYRARIDILRELFPWDDPNYGIDEQWAVFYPRGVNLPRGETAKIEVRITNHSPAEREFHVTLHTHEGLQIVERQSSMTLPSRQAGQAKFQVRAGAAPGNYLVTADVASDDMEFRHWTEALVTVE